MGTVDPETSLASLVLDHPQRAELFEQLGFDYCCRGSRSLAAACTERDLDVDTLVRVMEAHASSVALPAGHDFDCRTASTAELVDHIVSAHHERLRRELPRLAETLTAVVRAHGRDDARLMSVARLFDDLARELHEHLDREERLLFPACTALESGEGAVDADGLLAELVHDHADTGETLARLRELTDDYRPESARCTTHRALLDGLAALERDLHLHIHEENNILFPRVRDRLAT